MPFAKEEFLFGKCEDRAGPARRPTEATASGSRSVRGIRLSAAASSHSLNWKRKSNRGGESASSPSKALAQKVARERGRPWRSWATCHAGESKEYH